MKQIRSAANWRSPRPYSAGIVVGDLVFLSGHVPVDADGSPAGRTVRAQTTAVLRNLGRTLAESGLGPRHIVSTTVYLTDMSEIDGMDAAFSDFFGQDGPFPTRTTVQISSLGRPEFAVEISAIAISTTP